MTAKNNIIGWFETPVTNMERAMKFYETIMDFTLSRNQKAALDMARFPWVEERNGSAGSLVCSP